MERVKKLLSEQLNESLNRITMSNPRKGEGIKDGKKTDKTCLADKVQIRPLLLHGELFFQESAFVGAQIFHKNLTAEEMAEEICTLMEVRFKQMQLVSDTMEATVLISKKHTVTVKEKYKELAMGNELKKQEDRLSHNRTKNYILKEGIAVPFLIDLGVQTPDGRIKKNMYDKYRQINRFLEFIEDVLDELPKDRKISILDFGCGKSYLTFAMYYYLTVLKHFELDVIGLDLKKEVIQNCNALAKKYGYEGLHFLEKDIRDYTDKEEIDMVVSLHACDTATDYAIARAIGWNARVILSVPCCQHELNGQIQNEMLSPVLKYGLLKERMSAILTDAIRGCTMEAYGYDTQILEFIDMQHTPKNILLRGVKRDGFLKKGATMEEVRQLMEALSADQTLVRLLEQSGK